MIRILHDRIDSFFRKAVEEHPAAFACGPGCSACCRVDLTVFPVEAERVRTALQGLSAEARQAAADRVRASGFCALLDEAGRCIAYDARPSICRSHGLAILVDGHLDPCPQNYREQRPRREHVLDVERLNEALVRIDAAAGGRGERVRLADVVLEVESGPATDR